METTKIITNKIHTTMGEMADEGYSFEEIAVAVMTGDCFADEDYAVYTVYDMWGNEFSTADDTHVTFHEDGKIRVISQILGVSRGDVVFEYAFIKPAVIVRSTRADVLGEPTNYHKLNASRRKVQFGRMWVRIPAGEIIYQNKPRKISYPKGV